MADYECEKCETPKETFTDDSGTFIIKPCQVCDGVMDEVTETAAELTTEFFANLTGWAQP